MAAPRKTTQPVNTDSGDNKPHEDEATPEQTPAPTSSPEQTEVQKAGVDDTAAEHAAGDARLIATARTAPTTEEVVLTKDVGGHRAGDTITVTLGAADYLREQGYVKGDEDDED